MTNKKETGKYLHFFAMIGTSMVAMFILMYSHSYEILNHTWFSETRLFMTLIMGAVMMIIMLAYMINMYENTTINISIFIGAGLLLLLSIGLVRSQVTVSDVNYMKGMIPHHSIAILTSERAEIKDQRVRELADKIIQAQVKEIREMEWLIEDIKTNGLAETEEEAESRSLPDVTVFQD
ncbi:MAG: DUF305 domain-containing protein [Balneolaceae bacterium]